MSASKFSRALRTLGLATVLIAGAAAPSFADGLYVPGPTASPAWSAANSRTPLAGNEATRTDPAQNFLLHAGATGNGGQHS
ncbi:hypothetical protein ACFQX4_09275 [Roseomonas sp. GCM10028921]